MTLHFKTGFVGFEGALREVFRSAFAASEGETEGDAIAELFDALTQTTPADELDVISAWRNEEAVACLTFTRLRYGHNAAQVVLMAPVAVVPMVQRSGVGQALIGHGLDVMRSKGATIAVTYGDPNYYGKSGFAPVTVDTIPAPHPLSMPHGWQAVALNGEAISDLKGPATCAPAWNRPEFW